MKLVLNTNIMWNQSEKACSITIFRTKPIGCHHFRHAIVIITGLSPRLSCHVCFPRFLTLTPQKREKVLSHKKLRAANLLMFAPLLAHFCRMLAFVPGRRFCSTADGTSPHRKTRLISKRFFFSRRITERFFEAFHPQRAAMGRQPQLRALAGFFARRRCTWNADFHRCNSA